MGRWFPPSPGNYIKQIDDRTSLYQGCYAPASVSAEFPVRRLDELRLGPYAAGPLLAFDFGEGTVHHVSCSDSDQVGRNRHRLVAKMVSTLVELAVVSAAAYLLVNVCDHVLPDNFAAVRGAV